MPNKSVFFIAVLFTFQICSYVTAQTKSFYSSKQIGEKTWLINEPGFEENIYLLEGNDSALLIDAGFGMGNLRDFVKTLTSKPLIIVNTHFHPDHTGGDYQFPLVYIGTNDAELARPFLDPKVIQQITSTMLSNITIDISQKYPASQTQNTALISLNDNYIFKLGARDVQVINVPGHTPGSVFLLDRKNKTLYTGDNMQTTWLFFKESLSVATYKESLEKLNRIKGYYDILLPGHGNSLPISLVDELKECCDQILNGKSEAKPYHSMIGQDGVSCTYKTVTIAYDPAKIR